MDTIILRNFRISLAHTNSDILQKITRIKAKLIIEDIVHDETNPVESESGTWMLGESFLISIIHPSFSIGIVQLDEQRVQFPHGVVDIDTTQIQAPATQQETRFVVETSIEDAKNFMFQISFTAYAATSNFNKGASLDSVISVAKSMQFESIIALLTQILLSDTASMSPDQGLLNVIYGALLTLPEDDTHLPRSLGLLANVHLARYDVFLKIVGDDAEDYAVYPIYNNGINKATSMLERALKLAAVDHPKKTWIMISLCMCYQRQMLRQISKPSIFRDIAVRLQGVVSNLDDHEAQKPILSNYLGVALANYYTESKDESVLDIAITALEDAIRLTPDSDPHMMSFVANLIEPLTTRNTLHPTAQDARRLLDVKKQLLSLTPDDERDKLGLLVSLAHSFLVQFKENQNLSDIEDSISLFEKALKLTAETHPLKPGILNDLAASLAARGGPSDLHRGTQCIHDAISITPDNNPLKIQYLKNLGTSVLLQFQRDGWNLVEFQKYTEAIQGGMALINDDGVGALVRDFRMFINIDMTSISTEVILDEILPQFTSIVTAIPDDCQLKSSIPFELGFLLFTLFKKRKDRLLIDESILLLEQCVTPSASSSMNILWTDALVQAHLGRYVQFKVLSDLETAFHMATTTLDTLPEGHKDKRYLLGTLSSVHYQQFLKERDAKLLDQSIATYQDALKDISPGIPQRFRWLSELGCAYLRRFEDLRRCTDIDNAIQSLEDGLKGLVNDIPTQKECLTNLTRSLFFQFNQSNQMSDLRRAVAYLEESFYLETPGDYDMSVSVNQLHDDMVEYFRKFSGIADIRACASELALMTRDEDTLNELNFHILGLFLSLRFPALEMPLDMALLDSFMRTVDFIPDTHRKKSMWLVMMADAFTQQFDITGDGDYLDKAISLCDEAIQHRKQSSVSIGSPFSCTMTVVVALNRRFYLSGNLADLNRSIGILADSLAICPDREAIKYRLTIQLASSLMHRYDILGDVRDFEKSANGYLNAMDLIPSNDAGRHLVQTNIGKVFLRRLKLTGDIDDANNAVGLLKDEMESLPEENKNKVDAMAAYSMAVLERYWYFHDADDISEAVNTLEAALSLLKDDSSRQAHIMHNLGSALAQRYVQSRQLDDINRCLSLYLHAQHMIDDKDSQKYMLLFDIGRWLPARYERLHDVKDLDDADKALSEVSLLQSSPYRWRFRAASLRGYWSQSTQRGDPIDGYTAAMQILPYLVWPGISIQNRQHQLLEVGKVVLDAVAASIQASRYDLAIEWLEQGRSIIWDQILELRSPADALLHVYPDVARRFVEVSNSLGNMESDQGIARQQMFSHSQLTDVAGSQLYHELADERDKLLRHIRSLDGFENFLKPKDKASLLRASEKGLVITINVNQFRSDALVLLPAQEKILHIPLVNFSATEAYDLMKTLKGLLTRNSRLRGNARASRRSPFLRRPQLDPESAFEDILARLWTGVARPVLDGTGLMDHQEENSKLPHIYWCLTGPLAMLPIHAAGLYESNPIPQTNCKVSDYAVSSYIPSLGTLINCMEPRRVKKPNLVAVSLPVESNLPSARAEIDAIKRHSSSFPVTFLTEKEATRENVLNQMQSAGWVHFACHGMQNTGNPNMSALMLSGGAKLTLSDISELSLPHAELAFLSACQTATGDELLPEEAVHMAAGMLSAGYQSVVGTMWPIFDEDGPKIADVFYSHLFSNPNPDPADAAYALHVAVQTLREDLPQRASFFSWVPFIHYGI